MDDSSIPVQSFSRAAPLGDARRDAGVRGVAQPCIRARRAARADRGDARHRSVAGLRVDPGISALERVSLCVGARPLGPSASRARRLGAGRWVHQGRRGWYFVDGHWN